MAIPDYQALMVPLLDLATDGATHSLSEACSVLGQRLGLSDEEMQQLLPSGKSPVFKNRIGWAKTYLTKAGLLDSPKRAHFTITTRGRQALENDRTYINAKYLERYPEFQSFQSTTGGLSAEPVQQVQGRVIPVEESVNEQTPDEQLFSVVQQIRKSLVVELASMLKQVSPRFFENLVVQLLVAMGYGGSFKDAAQVVGKSGDKGIDGIIKEDRLGLDNIYVQAKRWDERNLISRPQIQQFVGALNGARATKGIFISSGRFSESAREYVRSLPALHVVLIDGDELCRHMIDYGVGVETKDTYVVQKIDLNFFDEDSS